MRIAILENVAGLLKKSAKTSSSAEFQAGRLRAVFAVMPWSTFQLMERWEVCMCLLLLLVESSRCCVWYDMICLRFLIRYMIFLRCILDWLVVQPLSIDPPYAGIAYTVYPVFLKHVAVQSCWQGACTHVHDTAVILMRITYEFWDQLFPLWFTLFQLCGHVQHLVHFCVSQQSAASPDLLRRWSHEGTVPSL